MGLLCFRVDIILQIGCDILVVIVVVFLLDLICMFGPATHTQCIAHIYIFILVVHTTYVHFKMYINVVYKYTSETEIYIFMSLYTHFAMLSLR